MYLGYRNYQGRYLFYNYQYGSLRH